MRNDSKEWNVELIQALFDATEVYKILKTLLLHSVREDKLFWKHEKNGEYHVKSAYDFFINEAIDKDFLLLSGKKTVNLTCKNPTKSEESTAAYL